MDNLVSIIIPCYNGENKMHIFLDSLANQSYTNIEVIFVDDGSIDRTKEIFFDWKQKNKDKLKTIKYIYQNNKGQAAAINTGLKYVTGNLLMWCDCDDYIYKDNVKLKVEQFEKNEKLDLVFCSCINKNIETNKIISVYKRKRRKEIFFEDLILEKNVNYCPAVYMIKFDSFKRIYSDLKIYESRGGQNWQILLPIVYSGNIKYIDQVLVDYSVYSDSHSHRLKSLEEIYDRLDTHQDIIEKVLNIIKLNDRKDYYYNIVKNKYISVKFRYAVKFDSKDLVEYYFKLEEKKKIKDIVIYIAYKFNLIKIFYKKRNY